MRLISIERFFLRFFVAALSLFLFIKKGGAQTLQNSLEASFLQPKGYVVHFTKSPPSIDGNIEDSVWNQAVWTDSFQDIEGGQKPAPSLETKTKMLWNDSCLFIAASLEDPHVWATLKKHDAIVYQDNDFEVFLDPDNDANDYFEIEANAWNTIFDLFLSKPYRNGGKALIPFEIESLQSAVKVKGTVNDPTDKDSGWTVEMAIPFRSVTFGNAWSAPEEGTMWRINFSRVQWDVDVVGGRYSKRKNSVGKTLPEHNWVWSPQGLINMHFPERWGYLQFTRNGATHPAFELPYAEKQKRNLWTIYYRQKEYYSRKGVFAPSLGKLGVEKTSFEIEGVRNTIKLEATSLQFTAYISDEHQSWSVNEEGQVKPLKLLP